MNKRCGPRIGLGELLLLLVCHHSMAMTWCCGREFCWTCLILDVSKRLFCSLGLLAAREEGQRTRREEGRVLHRIFSREKGETGKETSLES